MYDIVIIGSGPAGSTLARLLSPKYKTCLIERRNLENKISFKRQKCCGGLLDPDAQKMLAYFKLGLPKDVIVNPQMFAVNVIDLDNNIERYYQRHYVNVDREKFDRWLFSLIPNNVEKITNTNFIEYNRKSNNCIEVLMKSNGSIKRINAKIIIGADGAFSKVRYKSNYITNHPKVYLALQEYHKVKEVQNSYFAIFDKSITDFYSWLIPKKNYIIIGSALDPKKSPNLLFNQLKQKLSKTGYTVGPVIRKESTLLFRPMSINSIETGNKYMGLIGEAAGFISPSSAEGISYAFKSALYAAESLLDSYDNWHITYKNQTKKLKQNILLKNLKRPVMYNKHVRNIVMRSNLGCIMKE